MCREGAWGSRPEVERAAHFFQEADKSARGSLLCKVSAWRGSFFSMDE